MSLLEAMYAGCPPVARHAPGPDLIIEPGTSGYLPIPLPSLLRPSRKQRRTRPAATLPSAA